MPTLRNIKHNQKTILPLSTYQWLRRTSKPRNLQNHTKRRKTPRDSELIDREKTMRGLKKKEMSILSGYQIFHNYIRPHEGLDGKTPAEACGIKIEGKNKWLTLIQNASESKP